MSFKRVIHWESVEIVNATDWLLSVRDIMNTFKGRLLDVILAFWLIASASRGTSVVKSISFRLIGYFYFALANE